jgi:hypothetical protein
MLSTAFKTWSLFNLDVSILTMLNCGNTGLSPTTHLQTCSNSAELMPDFADLILRNLICLGLNPLSVTYYYIKV